jgi:hypothetical protein
VKSISGLWQNRALIEGKELAADEDPNISGNTLFDSTSVDAFGVSSQRGAVLLCSLHTVHRELDTGRMDAKAVNYAG